MRENRATKARRLLAEGRVELEEVRGRYVSAWVRGETARYQVVHDHGSWLCPCSCRTICSHVAAVMLVTKPVRVEAIQ